MGIQIEFHPDLALRDHSEFEKGNRKEEECVPKRLEVGKVYEFLKRGQRVYYFSDNPIWSRGEIPLMKTEGGERLSRPVASIKMLEATHFLLDGETYTKGKYKVVEVFDPKDKRIHFNACAKV